MFPFQCIISLSLSSLRFSIEKCEILPYFYYILLISHQASDLFQRNLVYKLLKVQTIEY